MARLPRQIPRLVSAIFSGHVQMTQHLSIMDVCNFCKGGPDTSIHFEYRASQQFAKVSGESFLTPFRKHSSKKSVEIPTKLRFSSYYSSLLVFNLSYSEDSFWTHQRSLPLITTIIIICPV